MKTRMLIVDGYAPFRANLATFLLSLDRGYEVAGEAASDERAMELVRRLCPDLVLVELNLPDRSGLATASAVRRCCPDTAVILMTNHADPEYRRAALAAGVLACVDKPSLVEILPGVLARFRARDEATDAEPFGDPMSEPPPPP